MAESGVSFREVPQNRTFPLRCKEITLVTGGTSGTLHDQKLPETAGGYAYRDSGRIGAPTRNRFLYWRTHQDVLELTEESLDVNLSGNAVRFRFQDAPILGGISVHEAHSHVVILVATVSSVHRLMFPHPNKLHQYDHGYMQGTRQSTPSILADVSVASAREPTNSHLLRSVGGTVYQVHTAAAWLTPQGQALFALATNTGSILLVKLPLYGIQGIITQHELKQSSVMQRLWTGLVPAAIRGGSDAQTSLSLEIHPLGQDNFIFAVCQDHKLRMWSTKNEECVMVADLLDYIPDNIEPGKVSIGGQGHILRKAAGCTSQAVHLGIFLCFTDRCQFSVFQPVLVDSCYRLNHITTVFGPNEDLADFALTSSHLWTLWNNGNGEFTVRSAPIMSETPAVEDWLPVFMEPLEKGELDVPDDSDPRQTYADYIFYPGRFSTHELLRALNTYRRSLDPASALDMTIPLDILKMEVTAAVEHEIQVAASEYELADDEYDQLQRQQWARFFSCCTQYKQVGQKSIGVFADSNTGLVCIVKKNCVSLVRPCHVLEHLYLSGEGTCLAEDLEGYPIIGEDMGVCRDVVQLCDCLKLLSSCLTPEMEFACEQDIYHAQSPNVVAQQLVKALLMEASSGEMSVAHTLQDIKVQLQTIQDVVRAADLILRLLDLAQGHPEDLLYGDDIASEAGRQLSCCHLFASRLATETLCNVLRQMADSHFLLTRDLLLLLTLIITVGEQTNVPLTMAEQIRSDLIGRASILMPEYFLLRWCAETVATPVAKSTMDVNLRQLEALGLSEAPAVTMAVKNIEGTSTLLELFLQGYGGIQLRALMANYSFLDDDPCALWSSALIPSTTALAQLLWPVSASFGFAEFLLVSCQYIGLQEYVRLTRDWCDWNEASRQFMLASSYLNTNEPYKAVDHFVETAHGVNKDGFLKALLQQELSNPRHAEVIFFLKVIRLFELRSLPHQVVTMATTAISVAEEDDPNLPTLWSKIFKHHLELGHNDEAYAALIANPDPSRRKDCLRQLLVVLCERGQLQQLVEFPYIDLHDEVVSIMESRARSVDLTTHNYYDLLYAFQIYRGNFRKAGSVMYEFGMRLGREVPGLRGLQQQAKCYLAALNALRLVDPKYAWIIKPGSSPRPTESEDMESQSPKHSWDGEELEDHSDRNLEVLELTELEREYLLVNARLRLLQKDPDPAHMTGPTPSAAETVDLLTNAGLYDCAVNICRMFDMPLTAIFESLASRCVRLAVSSTNYQQGDNDYTSQAWVWLEENDLGGVTSTSDVSSSSDQAWRLLQKYLKKHEDPTTRYHKAVAEKMLCQAFALPNWFIASYKRLNAAELLRLYLDYDLLEEAAHLLLEYLDAVLGCGAEYFGLKTCLHYAAPSVWLPYTCIDQLLIALKDVNSDTRYQELYQAVEKKLTHYHNTLEKISCDMINAAQTRTKLPMTSQMSHRDEMMDS